MTAPLAIVGAYARSAVGETMTETIASLAAGVRRVCVVDSEPRVLAALAMPANTSAFERTMQLCEDALAPASREGRVGLLLAVDMLAPTLFHEPRLPSAVTDRIAQLVRTDRERLAAAQEVAARSGFARWTVAPSDSTLATALIAQARAWLEEGVVDRCIVGGVSTSCTPEVLAWRSTGPLAARFGAVAGEAAAFLEVARGTPQTRPLARLLGEACGMSARDKPLALEEVVEAALVAAPNLERRLARVVLDSNGLARGKEAWALAATRTLGRRRISVPVIEPLLGLGDVGAATLPLCAAFAIDDSLNAAVEPDDEPRDLVLVVLCHSASPGWAALTLQTCTAPLIAPSGA